MAEQSPGRKKPRIRKSAPTVRERVEAASAEREPKQPGRIKTVARRLAKPTKRLGLRESKIVSLVAKPLRPVGRALSWLAPKYLVNSWREVRLVVWPNRRETWRLTLAVFIFAIVFGALVAGVDKGLDEVFKKLVLK